MSTKTLRIIHVIDSLAVGGAERMLVEIVNRTSADGHRVSVCVTRSAANLAYSLRPEVPLEVLGRSRRFDMHSILRFASFVAASQACVIHTHGRSSFSFVVFAKSLGLIRQPIALHDHFGRIEIDDSVPNWFQLWGRHFVGHYVGVYSKLADWARRAGIPERRISVIENALDLEPIIQAASIDLYERFGISRDHLVGAVIGGLRREKGIDFLLDALARIHVKRPFTILIVGAERDKEYTRLCYEKCHALGLYDTVRFVGESLEVPGLLKGVDFALLPSRSESGPLVLIEYIACGLPFVATCVGAISQRIAGLGVPGFVAANDPTAFAEALQTLLSLPTEQRYLRGELGRSIAMRYYDIKNVIEDWYSVYHSAIGGER